MKYKIWLGSLKPLRDAIAVLKSHGFKAGRKSRMTTTGVWILVKDETIIVQFFKSSYLMSTATETTVENLILKRNLELI